MAHKLAKLLGARPREFDLAIRQLELATGRSGVDVSLISDILTKSQAMMRMMGLDPSDTTPHELYRALGANVDEEKLFRGSTYVAAVVDGQVISCSRADVRRNLTRDYDDRVIVAMRRALVRELERRYHSHSRTVNTVVTNRLSQAGIPDLSTKKEVK